jgi:diphthamide biosynthesis protein 2
VTPFELQLALQPSPMWTGEYMLDFEEVLTRGPPVPSPDDNEEADTDRPEFSLVTGRYRHAKRYGGELPYALSSVFYFFLRQYVTEGDRMPAPEAASSSSSALIPRDQGGTVTILRDSAAGMSFPLFAIRRTESFYLEGEFLQSRTFRGLETRAGLDPPSLLQQGRTGIARGYRDDHQA